MIIKEFEIRDYGPLPDLGLINLDKFNLFYGKNESGKTLILDALIKMMMGRPVVHKAKIERVKQKPIGHIKLIDNNNGVIILKGDELFSKSFEIAPKEFYNIFIIRDSDLKIEDEKGFYNNITDRLLGLRINDIKRIDEELLDIGKLTASGKFRNTKGEKFDERMKEARKKIKSIKDLVEEIDEEKLDLLEVELIQNSKEIKSVKQEIENYDSARNREKYELAFEALTTLKEAKGQLDTVILFNELDIQNWRVHENNIKTHQEQKTDLNSKLQATNEELQKIQEKFKEKAIELKIPEKAKKKLDEKIKPELIEYTIKKGELEGQNEYKEFFTKLWLVSLILFGAFLIVGLTMNITISYFIALFFAILTVSILIFFKFPYLQKKAFIEGFIERVDLELASFDLGGHDYQEISIKITNFENEFLFKVNELNELNELKIRLESNLDAILTERIPYLETNIKKNEESINLLKKTSKVKTAEEYEENLNLKREIEKIIEAQRSRLSIFNISGPNEEETILNWEKEILKLEKFKDQATEIIYDEQIYSELKEKMDELLQHSQLIDSKYSSLKDSLREIEYNANLILQTSEDYLFCTTTNDLEKIREKLESFVNKNNELKNNILEIRDIFSVIENKEKEKISDLLSKKSNIFRYFKEITDDLYEEVIINMDPIEVKVRRKDGQIFDLTQLSGGTYDQLYLSIRLALGEKVLKDHTGFFILDDPFIKSDSERLSNQLNLLKKVKSLGWQILYFTCKDEVIHNLKMDIQNNEINFIELNKLVK